MDGLGAPDAKCDFSKTSDGLTLNVIDSDSSKIHSDIKCLLGRFYAEKVPDYTFSSPLVHISY